MVSLGFLREYLPIMESLGGLEARGAETLQLDGVGMEASGLQRNGASREAGEAQPFGRVAGAMAATLGASIHLRGAPLAWHRHSDWPLCASRSSPKTRRPRNAPEKRRPGVARAAEAGRHLFSRLRAPPHTKSAVGRRVGLGVEWSEQEKATPRRRGVRRASGLRMEDADGPRLTPSKRPAEHRGGTSKVQRRRPEDDKGEARESGEALVRTAVLLGETLEYPHRSVSSYFDTREAPGGTEDASPRRPGVLPKPTLVEEDGDGDDEVMAEAGESEIGAIEKAKEAENQVIDWGSEDGWSEEDLDSYEDEGDYGEAGDESGSSEASFERAVRRDADETARCEGLYGGVAEYGIREESMGAWEDEAEEGGQKAAETDPTAYAVPISLKNSLFSIDPGSSEEVYFSRFLRVAPLPAPRDVAEIATRVKPADFAEPTGFVDPKGSFVLEPDFEEVLRLLGTMAMRSRDADRLEQANEEDARREEARVNGEPYDGVGCSLLDFDDFSDGEDEVADQRDTLPPSPPAPFGSAPGGSGGDGGGSDDGEDDEEDDSDFSELPEEKMYSKKKKKKKKKRRERPHREVSPDPSVAHARAAARRAGFAHGQKLLEQKAREASAVASATAYRSTYELAASTGTVPQALSTQIAQDKITCYVPVDAPRSIASAQACRAQFEADGFDAGTQTCILNMFISNVNPEQNSPVIRCILDIASTCGGCSDPSAPAVSQITALWNRSVRDHPITAAEQQRFMINDSIVFHHFFSPVGCNRSSPIVQLSSTTNKVMDMLDVGSRGCVAQEFQSGRATGGRLLHPERTKVFESLCRTLVTLTKETSAHHARIAKARLVPDVSALNRRRRAELASAGGGSASSRTFGAILGGGA